MTKITIRDYQNSDWKQTLALMIQTMDYHMEIQEPVFHESYTVDLLRSYQRGLTAKHRLKSGKLLVAEDTQHKKVVGFIYGEMDDAGIWQKSLAKSASFSELCVDESYRGQHIGQLLMEALTTYFKNKGCTLIRLKDVYETNISAKKLYEKLGYKPRVIEFAKVI